MSGTETINLSDLISSRAETYGLLSRLYRVEVDQPLLDQIKRSNFHIDIDNQDIVDGYALWRKFQQEIHDETLINLAIDYVRTFVGTGKSSNGAAYPYESVYTSEFRLLMQDARDKVLELYRAEGIDKTPDFCDPEDHLALELSFMVFLNLRCHELMCAGKQPEAVEYLKQQHRFLKEHLINWVPTLCRDIAGFAREDLYRGLALVTRGFLAIDDQVLTDLIEELTQAAA